MSSDNNIPVLAMYDIRGIQDYIFKTPKLKDAIGASAIIENLLSEALEDAVKDLGITSDLDWKNGEYIDNNADVQTLYVGGGNAFVSYSSRELCVEINRHLSMYVIEHTYSLQLAIAIVDKTDNYKDDYARVNKEMIRVKAAMSDSRPIGALPVMDLELSTGLPLGLKKVAGDSVSHETYLKRMAEQKIRENVSVNNKNFEEYIEEKGTDSTLAVVHIDGNNMGMRIRSLIEGESSTDYSVVVSKMRKISKSIDEAFKEAFDKMAEFFNTPFANGVDCGVLKVLTAGDDITYVCTGKIAIATVECFIENLRGKTLGYNENSEKYGFSVCAGIAYMGSHFPFSTAYEVAENCCESAKNKAKSLMKGDRVGNYFDFQFCKNIQALNLEEVREREYMTAEGEQLLLRPYEIAGKDSGINDFETMLKKPLNIFANLSEKDERKLPRGFAKKLRNTYSLGQTQVKIFTKFLESRNWKLPDGDYEAFVDNGGINYAKYYDALELMDCYVDYNNLKNCGKVDHN